MNIAMLLEMAADGLGDRPAVGAVTYDELRRRVRAAAGGLAGSGATTLALVHPNGVVVPVALFAAAWAGVSYAPLNYRLPQSSLDALIARLQPALVVTNESGS